MTASSIAEAVAEAVTEAAEAMADDDTRTGPTYAAAEAVVDPVPTEGEPAEETRRKALASFLTEAWHLGHGANVWKSRAARAWADLFPAKRSDVAYNASEAGKAAEALGILGCEARQYANYAKAGEALRQAGFVSLRDAPTEAEVALVAEALSTARKGDGSRKANRVTRPTVAPTVAGGSGRGPLGDVVTEAPATEAEGPKVTEAEAEALVTEAAEAESWSAEVLSTLRRWARNVTVVTVTEAERDAIAEAAAHLVARLEAEAERREAVAKASDAAARNQAEAEAAKTAKAEAAKPAPRPRAPRKAAAKAA